MASAKKPEREIRPAPEDTPLPNIIDMQGRLLDIQSKNSRPQFVIEGQEGPGSIFHVPSAESPPIVRDEVQIKSENDRSIAQTLALMRKQGFQGENIITYNAVRPGEREELNRKRQAYKDRLPHAQKNYRVVDGQPPSCTYCQSILKNEEDADGFDLQELYEVAKSGCETCDVLQQAIAYFAKMIYFQYDRNRVWVKQSKNEPSRLLSQTKQVEVRFEEYQDETLTLSFSAHESQDDRSKFPTRRVEDTSSDMAIKLIHSWLGTCKERHSQCQIPQASPLPKRVLHLYNGRIRLLEAEGQIAPYVTLSHCWGRPTWTPMTSKNIHQLKNNIPWDMLSKTFQDAVQITGRLGFQYLWIDGLCILQDDRQDWEYNVSRMSQIFSNSQLTISASRASKGEQGCFSSVENKLLNLEGKESRGIRNEFLWEPYQLEGRDRDGFSRRFTAQLKTPHGLYNGRLPKEPLLRRAWVLQEQILSPRIIHFASGELYFECKSHVACECSGWSPREMTTQWETRWRKAHDVLLEPRASSLDDKKRQERAMRHFEAYRAIIETYTELDITDELDRLPALSGITFGRQDQYLAGMWEEILLESLHWAPRPYGNRHMARRSLGYEGPTWSWASVEAPIRHEVRDFHKFKSSPKLLAKIVEVSCKPQGLDPRGRISSGHLLICGPTLEVKVTQIGFRHRDIGAMAQIAEMDMEKAIANGDRTRQDYEFCTYATLKSAHVEENCYLDIPLALCRLPPAEVRVGETLMLLAISQRAMLVLKCVDEEHRIRSRVAIFVPQNEEWETEGWDNSKREIVIIV